MIIDFGPRFSDRGFFMQHYLVVLYFINRFVVKEIILTIKKIEIMKFITNFGNERLARHEVAIAEFKAQTGKDVLSITGIAFDRSGSLLDNYSSLYSKRDCDLSAFWRILKL